MAWLFSSVVLLSACLLFLVQPMCAKMLLPRLGGTPAVWNTCMVFFQTGLLAGYAYAHFLPRWLGVGRGALLHVLLLVLASFTLPLAFPESVFDGWPPVPGLLALLALRAGLPFVLVASSGPLLQRWFVAKTASAARDPYFLYAASNLGSFLGLALFPLVVEPNLTLQQQTELWKFAYLTLAILMAVCIPWRARPESAALPDTRQPAPDGRIRGRWIVLAMIPSSLLLSVTTSVTTDIAPMPLLWVIPLAIYLLTFVLVFVTRPPIPHSLVVRWMPLVVVVLLIVLLSEASEPVILVLGLHLLGLFWLALVCHGELARTRPAAGHLTDFYLCVAVGGLLGGIFTALVAPTVFSGQYEYPLMIVLACYMGLGKPTLPTRADLLWAGGLGGLSAVLVLGIQSGAIMTLPAGPACAALMFGLPLVILLLNYMNEERGVRFALSLGAILLASGLYQGIYGALDYRERSYLGIHRVTEENGLRRLIHGNTIHGQQSLDPELRRTPLTYYSRSGPIGDVFRSLQGDPRSRRVGIVGLGTGTLAAYAGPGDEWTFFELDASVQRIAEDPKLFSYLADARAAGALLHVDLGDARMQLRKSSEKFGLLVIDAFGSDAIPVHLLTREAVQLYLDHLEPDGILAFHISNGYVDLEPVLAALAQTHEPPLTCSIRIDRAPRALGTPEGIFRSDWVVVARKAGDLAPVLANPSWRPARTSARVTPWTDDFSNLLQVLRRGEVR